MNCDQVFDILTRGPFPTGEPSDEAVEWHLEGCNECRRLAEALRPAVELLHEAIVDDETLSLPGYSGRLASDSLPWNDTDDPATGPLATGRSAMLRPAVLRRRVLRRAVLGGGKAHRMWRLAAATALGVMLALGLNAMGVPSGPGSPATPPEENPQALARLVALDLSDICFHTSGNAVGTMNTGPVMASPVMASPVDRGQFQCCARCHAEGRVRLVASEKISKVVQNCQVCHPS